MKKLHRRPNRFKGASVGLDLHISFIQYSILDQPGDERANDRVPADREQLLALIDQLEAEHGPLQVAFEASGSFLWVFDLLVERLDRDRVHVAAPSKVKAIANSQEKNDANDAWWLAYLLWEARLPEAFVAEGTLRDLRTACREVRDLIDRGNDLKRRMRGALRQLGLSLGARSDWHTIVGHGRIQRIVEQAQAEHGLQGEAIARMWTRIQEMAEETAYWEQHVERLAAEFDQVEVLKTEMPGVGDRIGPVVIGELGDPRRFHSAKAYAKATGLTPGYRESGGRRSTKKISRCGSAHVRWALTQAVMGCLRRKNGPGLAVKAWVDRLARRKGKKSAIVAAARKLAEAIWRLFNLGEAFDLTRSFGGPAMVEAGRKL